METSKPPTPRGLALYIRAIRRSRHGTPKQFAKRLADHGISWVALGGPWHDTEGERWINKPETIARYADALLNVGVIPHIWGYPWHDRVELFVDQMTLASDPDIDGWLLDPELGLKHHPAAARELVRQSRAANPYRILGFTSYGNTRGHRSFPWDEFAEPGGFDPFKECDYGSPQLYDVPESRVLAGMRAYKEVGFDAIIPSFGAYKFVKRDASLPLRGRNRKAVSKTPAELDAHLGHFITSEIPIPGAIGWAENFVNRGLWRVLARWADWLRRGAGTLPPLR